MELREVLEDNIPATDRASAPRSHKAATTRIKLWDLPVRVFHWSLVAAVTTVIVTGKIGGDMMEWHGKAGLAIVGLVAFRLSWGFLGSTHARFTSFVPSPARILNYLRGQWRGVGHNPLGALSVLALLVVLGVQAGTGLFSNDDIAFAGPLINLVDEDVSHWLTGWHHKLVNMIFALLGLHVAAIVYYVKFKKDNLVKPMVTGWKEVDPKDLATTKMRQAGPVAFVVSVLIAAAAVYGAQGAWIQTAKPAAAPAPAAANSTNTSTSTSNNAAPAW
ncbi:MAG: cytochrome B [Rubrivivax sp.]|nr:MAG: cytochrome B [Rubrivivax sp.]